MRQMKFFLLRCSRHDREKGRLSLQQAAQVRLHVADTGHAAQANADDLSGHDLAGIHGLRLIPRASATRERGLGPRQAGAMF